MKSSVTRSKFFQMFDSVKRFSRTSLSMHILPVVFALMFVMVIHRSADQQSAVSVETIAKAEVVSNNTKVSEQNKNGLLSNVIAIATPANASMVVMFCKTSAVLAKLARI